MYTPNPIDTTKISLNMDIKELSEVLARNTHEVWFKNQKDEKCI